MTRPETPPADEAPRTDAHSPARPDPRGPDELKAGRRLEEVWAERRRAAEREARAKASAEWWAAVEALRGADNNGAEVVKLRTTSRRGRGA
jgi:hypothetical protein